jgi:alkanesulfonate monooxygenase SsuD/methylene tetrahydromethanopterin reductase-like flavin-dependent oxidoreductase (luciferase family)
VHLLVSLTAHGWHPAAWRVTQAEGFAAAAPFKALVQTAERGGLDAVLLGMPSVSAAQRATGKVDGLRLDPLPLLGAMIGATSHIGLGAYWPGDVAEPYHVARVFATLDHLAGGRTAWITGLAAADELGTKYGNVAFPPTVDDAAARLAELVDVARQLWDSWEDDGFVVDQATGMFADPAHVHPIDHSGPFFIVRGPLNVPRPVQGQPVIMHCDMPSGTARADAAASAELVLANCTSIDEARALRADWRELAAEHGRETEALRLVVSLMPVLGETEDAAMRRSEALDALSGPEGGAKAALRFVGVPGAFAELMAKWISADACDGFDIRPAVLPTDLDMLVDAVVPILQTRGLVRKGYEHHTLRGHLGLRRAPSRFAA